MTYKELCISKKTELKNKFGFINLENPITFTDKLNWLKIYDPNMLKVYCADKLTIRDYCKEKLGKDLCIPILAVYEKPEQIEWDKLPEKFVIKCNHGSGMNLIITDKLSINRQEINIKINKWLNTKFGDTYLELHYNLIKPKVFIEKYEENNGKSLIDYRFLCFNGEPKMFIISDTNEYGNFTYNWYDVNGNFLPISQKYYPNNPNKNFNLPKNLNEMIKISKILSHDFKFVRVDFFEIEEKIYLAELTFYHCAGLPFFTDAKYDFELGNMLQL